MIRGWCTHLNIALFYRSLESGSGLGSAIATAMATGITQYNGGIGICFYNLHSVGTSAGA